VPKAAICPLIGWIVPMTMSPVSAAGEDAGAAELTAGAELWGAAELAAGAEELAAGAGWEQPATKATTMIIAIASATIFLFFIFFSSNYLSFGRYIK
jgi:hypothetical protein